MTAITKFETQSSSSPLGKEDGRRERGSRSRRRIIKAMFELIADGDLNPTAIAVAERAKVGLRTVFRHFNDMESIFEEMTEEVASTILPTIARPTTANTWQGRLLELADRKVRLYESVFPMQVALITRRFQSPFLQEQYKREVELHRATLIEVLPTQLIKDKAFVCALESCLTFGNWQRLREDMGLSVEKAAETMKLMMSSIAESAPSD